MSYLVVVVNSCCRRVFRGMTLPLSLLILLLRDIWVICWFGLVSVMLLLFFWVNVICNFCWVYT